jgi:hypothetical protein
LNLPRPKVDEKFSLLLIAVSLLIVIVVIGLLLKYLKRK